MKLSASVLHVPLHKTDEETVSVSQVVSAIIAAVAAAHAAPPVPGSTGMQRVLINAE